MDKIKKAFEDYIADEFPKFGDKGIAFIETPAIDHFEAGWIACRAYFRKLLEKEGI